MVRRLTAGVKNAHRTAVCFRCTRTGITGGAVAQETSADKTEYVLVVGQRSPTQATAGTKDNTPLVETPQSITVFDRAELDQLNIADLDQALRYVPGAAPDTRGASGSR